MKKSAYEWTIDELDHLEKYYKIKSDETLAGELKRTISNVRFTRLKYGFKRQGQTFNENVPEGKKWCWFCKEFHDKTEFNKNKRKPNGLQDECKRAVKTMALKRKANKNKKQIKVKEKTCKKCNILKPIEEFVKNVSTEDGYTNKCKECLNEQLEKKYILNEGENNNGK